MIFFAFCKPIRRSFNQFPSSAYTTVKLNTGQEMKLFCTDSVHFSPFLSLNFYNSFSIVIFIVGLFGTFEMQEKFEYIVSLRLSYLWIIYTPFFLLFIHLNNISFQLNIIRRFSEEFVHLALNSFE